MILRAIPPPYGTVESVNREKQLLKKVLVTLFTVIPLFLFSKLPVCARGSIICANYSIVLLQFSENVRQMNI